MKLEPPEYLFGKIMNRIKREQQLLNLRKRLIIFSTGTAGSIIAFVPALNAVRADLTESGILHFISLVFSDFTTVVTLWKELAFSVLESLPIISIAVFLAAIFMFLGCIKFLAQNMAVIVLINNKNKYEF